MFSVAKEKGVPLPYLVEEEHHILEPNVTIPREIKCRNRFVLSHPFDMIEEQHNVKETDGSSTINILIQSVTIRIGRDIDLAWK